MSFPDRITGERATAAVAVAAMHILLLGLLLLGLAGRPGVPMGKEAMPLLIVEALPPPPHPKSSIAQAPVVRHSGAPAPPALRAKLEAVVARQPIVLLPPPVPPAVSHAGDGTAIVSGTALQPGPGTGNAGNANGTGSGLYGDGDGEGGRGVPPRRIRGSLRNADYPAALGAAGVGGTVSVRYRVEVTGRVGDCEVTRSSGNADLDALTCRLIQRRFRFAPSLDPDGRPVRASIVEDHSWMIDDSERSRDVAER